MTKPIDIALIPPGALAFDYCQGRICQMALAGVLHDKAEIDYSEFYNHAWKARSVLWMLDNGAWEGELLSTPDLIHVAHRYGATEVVAPDVLGDAHGTLELTMQFLSTIEHLAQPHFDRKPQIAAVAHGRTLAEALAYVQELNTRDMARQVKTISISRTVCYKTHNPTARFELALEIKRLYGNRYDIHLLGLSDHWPTEIQHCASVPGLIRSLDTAAPFIFAYEGLPMGALGMNKVPRPDNYFELKQTDINRELLEHNIQVLDIWGRTPIRRWLRD